MRNKDLILMGLKNLWRRKARSALAISGVIIGTCSIVVMLSLGVGLSEGFKSQIESYGNLHLVEVSKGYSNQNQKDEVKLNDAAVAKMEKIPGVSAASPILSEYMLVAIGKMVTSVQIVGIKPEVMQKFGYSLESGRLLEEGDKYALVFGNVVPNWFYNPRSNTYDPAQTPPDVLTDKMILTANTNYGAKKSSTDDKTKYLEYKAKGVGLLSNPSDDSAYSVYINLDTLIDIKKDNEKARKESGTSSNDRYSGSSSTSSTGEIQYERIQLYVNDIDDVQKISKTLQDSGYQTFSLNDMLESMQKTARMIQGILGGIGAISLLVAALGITNTMIMSIYERTREIGVMKVIGSNLKDIQNLFLFEAALIGFFGGVAGLLLSYILSFVMNTILIDVLGGLLGGNVGNEISIIPIWLSILSLVFSTGIGVISGFLPARRAMKLSALESLRNE